MPDGAQIAAVTDAYVKKAEALQQQLGTRVAVCQDYRTLFDRTDLDGVIVTATDLHHVSAGVLACMAGLDAYVEKPAALRPAFAPFLQPTGTQTAPMERGS